jgi:hypothetical protein
MGGVEHGEPYDVGLVIDYVIQPQQGEVLGEGEERISWVSDMYEFSETETESEAEYVHTPFDTWGDSSSVLYRQNCEYM